jgi:tRNA A-37 threonylcarbamoyl transferase component Bud32/Tfp pilus assembly protein PilF
MSDLTGQTLGKYQLVERLGRGGMADVYKGYQPGLDRYVAVKVMHPHLAENADFITRFRREAKSVAELRHPYIVQVFDFDVQGDNYYMVMEYIEGGRTLKQVLQELAERAERLPLEQTLDIVAKLADALAYAHNLGMIHRDIKPANVLIASLDRPVLSDFGIARLMNESGLTVSGMLIGTPAYMSPEQGRGERIDARSDIYSLGIVLYEMLTGRPPYDADTPYAIILKHINDPLTPPHVLTSPMPEAVERIVLKCLAKDAEDRFASMAALREALRNAQSAIGVQQTASTIAAAAPTQQPIAQPTLAAPTAVAPASRSGSVKPVYLIAGACTVIALLAVALFLIFRPRPDDAGRLDRPPLGAAATDKVPPRPTNAPPPDPAITQQLEAGYRELFINDDNNAAHEIFDRAVRAAPDDPYALTGRAIAQLRRYSEVAPALADLEQAEKVIPDAALVHFARGLLYTRAEYQDEQQAEAHFTRTIDTCGDHALLCANAYYERGQLRAWSLDNVRGGLADLDRAIELHPERQQLDAWYARRASLRFELADDLDGAMADLQKAYEISGYPESLQQAAVYAVKAGEYDRALTVYEQIIDKTAGDPRYLAQRAYVEMLSGDAAAAQQTADRALSLHPDLLAAHYVKGLLLIDAGQPADALKEFEPIAQAKDAELYDMAEPYLNPRAGYEVHYDMARAAFAAGDLAAAQDYLDAALKQDKFWAEPYVLRAQLLKEQGDLAGARASYLQAKDYVYDKPELEAAIEKALVDLAK